MFTLQEAIERARQLEEEKRRVEEQQKEAERRQREVIARLQQSKAEKERRERELVENETKRAQEIYMSLRKVREEIKKKEEDDRKKEDEAWRQQEEKANEEERRRRTSVSVARREVAREREEAKRWSTIMLEKGLVSGGDRRQTFSVKPQRQPPPIPRRLVLRKITANFHYPCLQVFLKTNSTTRVLPCFAGGRFNVC